MLSTIAPSLVDANIQSNNESCAVAFLYHLVVEFQHEIVSSQLLLQEASLATFAADFAFVLLSQTRRNSHLHAMYADCTLDRNGSYKQLRKCEQAKPSARS